MLLRALNRLAIACRLGTRAGLARCDEFRSLAPNTQSPKALLTFFLLAAGLPAQIQFDQQQPGQIAVTINDRAFTTFYFGPGTPKAYLHPLRTATGLQVTRGWPMQEVGSEPHDHKHHRGLYFGHGAVNGINFWENELDSKSSNRGRVVEKSVEATGGAKRGTITAVFDWNDPGGQTILTEDRTMTFYTSPADERIIDFDITLTTRVPVDFGDTKEGTFAIRLAAPLDEKHTGRMINAEGKRGMKEVWGARSNWVDYDGELNAQKVGVAIFDHPANPGHPTRWHSRDYGLFAANPFGQKEFEKGAGEQENAYPAGQKLRFRYRVIIHPGDAESAKIADQWTRYAEQSK